MKATLTERSVEKALVKSKPYEIRDTKTVGFLLRVQPSGKKVYYCQYRRGGRVKIGDVGTWDAKTARERAKEVLVEYQKQGDVGFVRKTPQPVLTYRQFLELHYFDWVNVNHKSAFKTKRRLLNDCTRFHKVRLDEITPQMVEKWRTEKVSRGNSPHTANRCFAYLRASLSKAVEWGILDEHPLRRMKLIRAKSNAKVRYLAPDEESRLRATLVERDMRKRAQSQALKAKHYADHLTPMVLLSMNTGLRRGELLTMRWVEVNFNQKVVTVTAEMAKSKKQRHIPLNDEAYRVLTTWREQTKQTHQYVFTNIAGRPFKDVKKGWNALLEKAHIQNFRWHDMRHHFASKLTMAGVDLNTVRELLGHSSYEMTLRYAHLSAGHKADAVACLNSE